VIKLLALFLGVSVLFWVLLAVPARHLWEPQASPFDSVTYPTSAVALGLCLVPSSLTLLWAGRALGDAFLLDQRSLRLHLGTSLADLRVPVAVDPQLIHVFEAAADLRRERSRAGPG